MSLRLLLINAVILIASNAPIQAALWPGGRPNYPWAIVYGMNNAQYYQQQLYQPYQYYSPPAYYNHPATDPYYFDRYLPQRQYQRYNRGGPFFSP